MSQSFCLTVDVVSQQKLKSSALVSSYQPSCHVLLDLQTLFLSGVELPWFVAGGHIEICSKQSSSLSMLGFHKTHSELYIRGQTRSHEICYHFSCSSRIDIDTHSDVMTAKNNISILVMIE